MNVTVMISHHCVLVLLAVFRGDVNEACVISLYINVFLEKKKEGNKKKKAVPVLSLSLRGHQCCQLLIFLKATKHTSQCVSVWELSLLARGRSGYV